MSAHPNPEQIERVVFDCMASAKVVRLLYEVLGVNTYEIHPADLADMKRRHR